MVILHHTDNRFFNHGICQLGDGFSYRGFRCPAKFSDRCLIDQDGPTVVGGMSGRKIATGYQFDLHGGNKIGADTDGIHLLHILICKTLRGKYVLRAELPG